MELTGAVLIVQVVNLIIFTWFNRVALVRILTLSQQLAVYRRHTKKPKLANRDRLFWALLSRLWKNWALDLTLVKPETVIRWRKRKFGQFWWRKSHGMSGRPTIDPQHIHFIRRISSDHPEYGEDRIALELEVKFGILHSPATIRKYMLKGPWRRRDSQGWRTFLKNQAAAIWSCDFFVQHTARFRAIYVFVVMELASRRVVHFNVTEHPTLEWTKQQLRNACSEDQPKFLIHDNDRKFGQLGRPLPVEKGGKKESCRSSFDVWLWRVMDIRGIPIPYGAPNASAHVERLIGTLRRECLDRLLIWNERHLYQVLKEYLAWFNQGRVHQGLHGIPDPDPALAEPRPANGRLTAVPILNGLHHDYRLAA